uniref:hypothetical protein n=1 Tax=Ralstonia pseudosolanacearum TaxID=1310165 RepID=UPI001FF8BF9D
VHAGLAQGSTGEGNGCITQGLWKAKNRGKVTEADYAKALIEGYAQKHNQVAVDLVGMGKTYVSKDSVVVQVGPLKLWDVSETIVIGVPPDKRLGRPPKPKASEYVQLAWVQQGADKVRLSLAIDGQVLKPNTCGTDTGFFHCEFTVPHSLIPKPAAAIFTVPNQVPGVWQMASLSRAHYDAVKRKYAELDMPMSDDDKTDLRAIRKIDPAIPATLSN